MRKVPEVRKIDQNRKTAVVTGGHVGIGHAISCALARDGFRVAIGSRRGGDSELKKRMRELIAPDTFVHELDVRDPSSVETFRGAVQDECGDVLVLVNSAGISMHHTVCGHPLKEWNDVIDTNLNGTFHMMRAFMPVMLERGWGRIVNIASTAARTAVADHPAYCASKSGVLGLSRAAALEGAPHGVTCVTVSPTWVETDMLHESAAIMARRSGREVSEEIEAIARSNPQGRLVQPEEIAALVAFLCSEKAPALTMEDISVNAGAHW